MKTLELNKLAEVKFSVKHPFEGYPTIPVRANVKALENGGIEIVDMYYTDPRNPDKEVAYHSEPSLKIPMPSDDGDAEDDHDDSSEEDTPTAEEVDDMVVDTNVQRYVWNNIINILIENELCSHHVVLYLLEKYWTKHPYLRLAQIVSNAWHVHPDYKKNPEPDIQDVFYLTDIKFLEGLKLLIENESKDQGSSEG